MKTHIQDSINRKYEQQFLTQKCKFWIMSSKKDLLCNYLTEYQYKIYNSKITKLVKILNFTFFLLQLLDKNFFNKINILLR